jgi:hypothetical protein
MFTGTVFALTSVIESLAPISGSPLYTFVYNATILTFPGAFYVLSSAIFGLDIILLRFVAACRNLSTVYLTVDSPVVDRQQQHTATS